LNRPLTVGIIGLGKMGQIRAREIKAHPETTLVRGADPDTAMFAAFPGIELSRRFEDVIDSDVDLVFVCTPNHLTAKAIILALDAGKHVFSEKPPGRTVEEVAAIVEAERRNPALKLKFGFNHRYHAGIREAKRIVESGRLGKPLWMRGVYGKAGGPGFEQSWRSDRETAGGGILLDQGIHMLDLFRFFCGDFVEIKSMVDTAYWPIELEDNAFALLRDTQGRIAMLHSSSTQWKHRFSLEIYLSEGYLSVNGILTSTRSYGEETITVARRKFDEGFAVGKPREEIIYFDNDPSWELEQAEFVDCVLNDKPAVHGTSADAMKVMELVHRIYRDDAKHARAIRPLESGRRA
jgi:predicted dehydrogenase